MVTVNRAFAGVAESLFRRFAGQLQAAARQDRPTPSSGAATVAIDDKQPIAPAILLRQICEFLSKVFEDIQEGVPQSLSSVIEALNKVFHSNETFERSDATRDLSQPPDPHVVAEALEELRRVAASKPLGHFLTNLPGALNTILNSVRATTIRSYDHIRVLVQEFYSQDANWSDENARVAALSSLQQTLGRFGVKEAERMPLIVDKSIALLKKLNLAGRIISTLSYQGVLFNTKVLNALLIQNPLSSQLSAAIKEMKLAALGQNIMNPKFPSNSEHLPILLDSMLKRADLDKLQSAILGLVQSKSKSHRDLMSKLEIIYLELILKSQPKIKLDGLFDLYRDFPGNAESLAKVMAERYKDPSNVRDIYSFYYDYARSDIESVTAFDEAQWTQPRGARDSFAKRGIRGEIQGRVRAVEQLAKIAEPSHTLVIDLMNILKTSRYPNVRAAAFSALCQEPQVANSSVELLNNRLLEELTSISSSADSRPDPVLLHTLLYLDYDSSDFNNRNPVIGQLFNTILSKAADITKLESILAGYNKDRGIVIPDALITDHHLGTEEILGLEHIADLLVEVSSVSNANQTTVGNCLRLLSRFNDARSIRALKDNSRFRDTLARLVD